MTCVYMHDVFNQNKQKAELSNFMEMTEEEQEALFQPVLLAKAAVAACC